MIAFQRARTLVQQEEHMPTPASPSLAKMVTVRTQGAYTEIRRAV
jgi:hypothetical protein